MPESFFKKLSLLLVSAFLFPTSLFCATGSADQPEAVFFEKDMAVESTINHPFSDQSFVSVDNAGNIFIADAQDLRVYVYGPSGNFLKNFSRKGNGPGEFQRMMYFTALPDGRSVGYNFNGNDGKLIWFDENHQHEKTTRNDTGRQLLLDRIYISPKGNQMGARYSTFSIGSGAQAAKIAVFDMVFKETKVFHEEEDTGPPLTAIKDWEKNVAQDVKLFYQQKSTVIFDEKGYVFVTDPKSYKVRKWTPDLDKEARVYSRNVKPKRAKEAELQIIAEHEVARLRARLPEVVTRLFPKNLVEKTVNYMETPPVKPSIFGVVVAGNDLLFVIRDIDAESRRNEADVFASDGFYLGRVFLPDYGMMNLDHRTTLSFKNKFAYSLQIDDQDKVALVRYRYRVNKK
ncbi:MAG: 6-bladed beta-propeller [Acidobacteriota bacterium]|nr:6-bladed beta-propeller [Acidobacteriota bacterium]